MPMLCTQAVAELFQDPNGEYRQRLKAKSELYAPMQARTKQLMNKFYGVEDYAPAMKRSSPVSRAATAKEE